MRVPSLIGAGLATAVIATGAHAEHQAGVSAAAVSARAARILYVSDWSGTGQVYALDPSRGRVAGQLTFGRAPACRPGAPCGFGAPTPSPDGRRLLLTDYASQGPPISNLFVARADGRARRLLGKVGQHGFATPAAAWSPDSDHIAYSGEDGIHVTRAIRATDRRVRTSVAGDHSPAWSPGGGAVTFVHRNGDGTSDLVLVREGRRRVVARRRPGIDYAWSSTGVWIAVASGGGRPRLELVAPEGARRRLVTTGFVRFAWSPNGRLLAVDGTDGVEIVDVRDRSRRALGADDAFELAWTPDSRKLAYTSARGIVLADARTGRVRLLGPEPARSLSWSPDGRSLAHLGPNDAIADRAIGDLRVTSSTGRTRTVIGAIADYGGSIATPTWTAPPAGTTYRRPAARALAAVDADRLLSRWPVDRIAADGDRVAFTACGHVAVWTPAARTVLQAEASSSLSPACPSGAYYTSYHVYGLALAGDRVASATVQGGIGRVWSLGFTTISLPRRTVVLGRGNATNGPAYGDVVGEPHGAGELLAFSSWKEEVGRPPDTPVGVTTFQDVRRAPPSGCPCPALASSPGPLVPFDVDGGRVVAGGNNQTWLLDAEGNRLLAVDFSPVAGALSGPDLVLVRQGELRHYDATTGDLLHTWPLPDTSTGRECSSPNGQRCPYAQPARLVLEDAAKGLVAYVLDGTVRIVRLADGADSTVAPGTLARFVDSGLVYADGARLQLVPFDRLPLR